MTEDNPTTGADDDEAAAASASTDDVSHGKPESASILFQERLRHQMSPFLPPPVVRAMKQIDPQLEPWMGPEASITLVGSLVLALIVRQFLSWILGQWRRSSSSSSSGIGGGGGGGAIQDDVEEDAIIELKGVSYDATVLLCGPPQAGKTTLFYTLVYPNAVANTPLQTISSIKPNTGFKRGSGSGSGGDNQTWRYLDTPGHWGSKKLVSTVMPTTTGAVDRIVLVLDATQPVGKAADYLYELLRRDPTTTSTFKPRVAVACHKSKAPKAKNVRRLKLQIRNELERLSKLEHSNASATAVAATTTPTTIHTDWDEILQHQVGFVSTSINPPQLDELKAYLQTGTLPSQ